MARIELSNIGGGGTTLSLTTTGTSGASTLAGSVLNIPIYQGQLTLTTTGTSGAATLSGTTLNIPQYSGGGGTPAGSAGEVQFNSTPAGSFAASSNLAWDNSNVRLNIGAPSSPTGRLNVKGGGSSSGTSTQIWTNSGNVEAMRVRDDLRVGIRTSTPRNSLDVIDSSTGAVFSIQNNNASGYSAFDTYSSTGSLVCGFGWQNASAGATAQQNTGYIYLNNQPFLIRTGSTSRMYMTATGLFGFGTGESASAIVHVRGANATAGVGAFLVQDGAATPATIYRIDNDGKVTYRATNTPAGTTGAQTINQPSGTVNFAIGASALVVTNSLCTTSSIVFATVRTNDATAYIKNVVPAAGSFTINLGANATAETSVGFFIIN